MQKIKKYQKIAKNLMKHLPEFTVKNFQNIVAPVKNSKFI